MHLDVDARHASEPQAYDADVDPDRLLRKLAVLDRPVVPFHRVAEPFADGERLLMSGQTWNEKAEFVAAESRVQLRRRSPVRLARHEIVGTYLLLQ